MAAAATDSDSICFTDVVSNRLVVGCPGAPLEEVRLGSTRAIPDEECSRGFAPGTPLVRVGHANGLM